MTAPAQISRIPQEQIKLSSKIAPAGTGMVRRVGRVPDKSIVQNANIDVSERSTFARRAAAERAAGWPAPRRELMEGNYEHDFQRVP